MILRRSFWNGRAWQVREGQIEVSDGIAFPRIDLCRKRMYLLRVKF